MTRVHIIGSGVVGLTCADILSRAGCTVTLTTGSAGPDEQCCSWWAGGMLAPYCEQESAEPLIGKLGIESMAYWEALGQTSQINHKTNGTLVVAPPRDQALLRTFAKQTDSWQTVDAAQLVELEADLSHFSSGLFYANEAHLEPRTALQALWKSMQQHATTINTQQWIDPEHITRPNSSFDWQIDCRGLAAQDQLDDLRGVKGEMLHLYCPDVTLSRPIRLLHPRFPLYIVPRPNHQFMVGATMLESNERDRATVRSTMELLSAAYTLNPAFAEAQIIEIGVDARPAFHDNLPKIRRYGQTLYVNGMYRHGYLAAPAMARRVRDLILENRVCEETVDANYPEWPSNRNAANHA